MKMHCHDNTFPVRKVHEIVKIINSFRLEDTQPSLFQVKFIVFLNLSEFLSVLKITLIGKFFFLQYPYLKYGPC